MVSQIVLVIILQEPELIHIILYLYKKYTFDYVIILIKSVVNENTGLQKLGAHSQASTYRVPKTLIRYTKKQAPKINSMYIV